MNEEKKDIQNPITAAEPLPADHAIADEDGTIVPPDTQVKAHNAASSTPKNTANSTKAATATGGDGPARDDNAGKDTEGSKKTEEKKEENFGAALKEAIHEQAREDESTLTSSVTLRKVLGGDFLTASMIRRQIGMILIIVAFTIVYISNRYSCQRNLLEIDRLNSELQDAKYKALSSSSMLTEKCRESHVLDMLKQNNDSLLHIADQPPYIIYVPQN